MHRLANLRARREKEGAGGGGEGEGGSEGPAGSERGTTKSTALFPGAARSCSFAFNGRKNERDINREQCA